MATKNLVSAVITPEDNSAINGAFQTITAKMSFLISLTEVQRLGGLKLGDKTVGFVDKTMTYIRENPALVPNYLDTEELTKDYLLTKDLQEILRVARPLVQSIEDTTTEAGMEALAAALVFYNAIKVAAKQGVNGAQVIYEDLQKRFPGPAGVKTETEPTT